MKSFHRVARRSWEWNGDWKWCENDFESTTNKFMKLLCDVWNNILFQLISQLNKYYSYNN